VAELIAQKVRQSVRELEGAVLRLQTMVTIERRPMDVDNVRASLADVFQSESPRIDFQRILEAVLAEFDVTREDLESARRSRSVVLPRQIAMFLARRHTDLSLNEIGSRFGGRDHSTVLHALSKIEGQITKDPKIRSLVENVELALR
ncbi:MAG: chromosomal replication initiator protein DnaA, partial [Planctomycetes bacterium]|nr:chromosomal replication initiator protein DnaA [Planctomycetota bacterium]